MQLHRLKLFYRRLIEHCSPEGFSAEDRWEADRNSADRGCCHGVVLSGRSLLRAWVGDRANASGSISDSDRNRPAAAAPAGRLLPPAKRSVCGFGHNPPVRRSESARASGKGPLTVSWPINEPCYGQDRLRQTDLPVLSGRNRIRLPDG